MNDKLMDLLKQKNENKNQKKVFFRLFLLIAGVFLAYKLILGENNVFTVAATFIDVIKPFLVAVLIAYLLYIPSNSMEKLLKRSKNKFLIRMSRGISILTVYTVVGAIVYFALKLFIPFLIYSASDLLYNIPNYIKTAEEYFKNNPIVIFGNHLNVSAEIEKLSQTDISKYIIPKLSEHNVFGNILKVTSVVSFLFDAFLAIIVSIYFLIYREGISGFINKVLRSFTSKKVVNTINYYIEKSNYIFYKFVTTQILDSVIIGTILTIVFLVLKIDYAAPLGYMIGMLNLIPFFGAIIGVFIATVITIFTGGYGDAFVLLLAAIVAQQIDGNIIGPFLQGTSLKINQILIIASIPIFGKYFGVVGMFLAVPFIAVFALIVNDILNHRISERKKEEIKIKKKLKKRKFKLKKLEKKTNFN